VFAYDGDNLIEEANTSGAVVARYEQTQNIDEPLAMLRSSATSYYSADGLGSITSLTNSSGAAAQTYTYDSFGKVTGSSGSLTNPFQYTGREMDPETGLYYYRARYYDAAIGRFISGDPLGFMGEDNFYSYSDNDPQNAIDPSGLLHVLVWNSNGSAGTGTNWGHASILLDDGTYVSWWPGAPDDPANPNIIVEDGGKHFARNAREANYGEDVKGEGHGPDEDIYINTLDEGAIAKWWIAFKKNRVWDSFNRNCSTAVTDALKSGGAERFEKVPQNRFFPMSPQDSLDYAKKLMLHNHVNFGAPLVNPVAFN
jgi:RHS repeat-associated protein